MVLTKQAFEQALIERHGAWRQEKISAAAVGVAGLGGLGSNIAVFLARLGVGRLVLADFDRVDVTNLNRQQYRAADLGQPKPKALAEQLRQINPFSAYEAHFVRLTPQNIPTVFQGCAVICEAFDRPDQKAMLTETVLAELPDVTLVAGSGMAGVGSANQIQTARPMSRLYVCGDNSTSVDASLGLTAPRVAVCAAHQATMVMRLLIGESEP